MVTHARRRQFGIRHHCSGCARFATYSQTQSGLCRYQAHFERRLFQLLLESAKFAANCPSRWVLTLGGANLAYGIFVLALHDALPIFKPSLACVRDQHTLSGDFFSYYWNRLILLPIAHLDG